MRFFFTVLLVLSLSAPAAASEFWRIAAHSLHEANYRQVIHLEHGVFWMPDNKFGHFLNGTKDSTVIKEYHDFWHLVLDAVPYIVDDEKARTIYSAFALVKAYIVAYNNQQVTTKPANKDEAQVLMFYYTIYF